jgi:putative inorganic carbon (HCO3(-)) transporter
MRDIVLALIIVPACLAAFKRPWIGVMLWTWLSIMNPHRYTWGFAYGMPWAAAAVGCTVAGLIMTRERGSPLKGSPVSWFVAFVVFITLSWLMGLNVSGDYDQWKKVMKIDLMLLVALALLYTKQHIFALVCVCAASIGFLGAKGGLYTIATGGGGRVWGPPGSFIHDNNEFALAVIMTIPLLRFLHMQANRWMTRQALMALMFLCAASALGSQSRGALLALSAMAFLLWLRGKHNKASMGFLLIMLAVPLVMFMPDEWSERMSTINSYEQDGSAMGRINAWWVAWRIGLNYPMGVGFNPTTYELFARFAPDPTNPKVAHSIYFQVLGHHGFIGLAIFLGIWGSTWRMSNWLRNQKDLTPETAWTADLGAMCQVAIMGYLVGGLFLSLAYFDLPYNIMAMIVLTRVWVAKERWKTEPAAAPRWIDKLGISFATKAS